jgi:hypothetical protein
LGGPAPEPILSLNAASVIAFQDVRNITQTRQQLTEHSECGSLDGEQLA